MSDHRRFRTRQRKSVLHANPFRVLFALALLCGTGATAFAAAQTFDASDAGTNSCIWEIAHVGGIDYTYDVEVAGNYAYTANGGTGFKVFDVSNPTNPVCVATRNTAGNGVEVDLCGDYAYLVDGPGGVCIFDVSSPTNPTQVAHIDDFAGHAATLDVVGEYVYVGYNATPGFRIYDVSTRTNPTVVAHADGVTDDVFGVEVVGNYAYLGMYYDGLVVYDVSDVTNPVHVVGVDAGGEVGQLDISSNSLYLASAGGGVRVYDISNPTNPTAIANIPDDGGRSVAVQVVDSLLYVGNRHTGLWIYDVHNPTNPVGIADIDDGSGTGLLQSSCTTGSYVYVANDLDGLRVYEMDCDAHAVDPPSLASISGTITYSGGQTGTIHVQAFQSTGTVDLVSGLVAHYPFDGNADDASGNGNTATVHGASLTVDRFGITNGAYAFDGNDYIATPLLSLDTTTGLTLAGWARVNDITAYQGFVGAAGDSATYPAGTDPWNRHYIGTREGNYWTGAGNTQKYVLAANTISEGEWFSFAVTLGQSNALYYLNGVQVDATSYDARGVCGVSTYIGAVNDRGTARALLDGAVDDVSIYSRTLSPTEVQELWQPRHEASLAAPGAYSITNLPTGNYTVRAFLDANTNGLLDADEASGEYVGNPVFVSNEVTGVDIELIDPVVEPPPVLGSISGTVTYSGRQTGTVHVQAYQCTGTVNLVSGLVAYYPFSGSADDASGNGNGGIVHGAALTVDRFGKTNSAYAFSGNDYIATPLLGLDTTIGLTLAGWVRADNVSVDQAFIGALDNVVGYQPGTDPWNRHYAAIREGNYHTGAGNTQKYTVTATAISNSTWFFFAVTLDGSNAVYYVDGVEVDATPYVARGVCGLSTCIGANNDRGSPVAFLSGAVDDVAIYSRALSPCEVQALYQTHEVLLAAPGAYSITDLPAGDYAVGAYLDANGNGIQDADEASGAYTGNPVTVSNDVVGVDVELIDPPGEMDVRGDGVSIVDGDNTPDPVDGTDFGVALAAAGTVVRTFVISNTANSVLSLTGTPVVAVSGAHAAEFTVTLQPSTSVMAHASTPFEVTFAPAGGGTRSAVLSIAKNDVDEDPYDFAIQGVGTLLPGATQLLSPTGVVTGVRMPTFDWEGVQGGEWYRLRILRDDIPFLDQWLQATEWTPSQALPAGQYRWWVQTRNLHGDGPWSSPLDFTVPPWVYQRPALVAPTGTITVARPRFEWTAVENANWYQVWVNIGTSTHTSKWVAAQTSYDAETDYPYGHYTWWVRGFGKGVYGPWSDSSQFAYGTTTPLAPSGALPASTLRPQFAWTAVPGATWYQVWVNRGADGHEEAWVHGQENHTPTKDYPYGRYTWWVRPWSPAGGLGPWSSSTEFVCGRPELIVGSSTTLTWSDTTTADAGWYHIWIGRSGTMATEREWWVGQGNTTLDAGTRTGDILHSLSTGNYIWYMHVWSSTRGWGPWSEGVEVTVP